MDGAPVRYFEQLPAGGLVKVPVHEEDVLERTAVELPDVPE